jgi:phospholipid/cholesterol/gamma-HCH transport system substrate-binding protein
VKRRAVAAMAFAGAALLSGCNISLQSLPKFSSLPGPFYEVHATFTNVLNLPDDAQVRAGVATIGQVSSIRVHDFAAHVTLQIQESVRLPVGTRAEVQFDDPLGNEYVEMLRPAHPSQGSLANGARLTERSTASAPSIADTLAALSTVLNGGGINQLHTIFTQLDATFNGNQPQLRDLIRRVEESFGSFARHTPDIDAALSALGNLSEQLGAGTPTIVRGIDALAPAMHVLASENTQLRQLLVSVNRLAVVAGHVADVTSQRSVADIRDLVPVVHQLVGVDRQIGPALADISSFEHLTPKIAPGNSLQVSLTATADLGGSGAVTSAALTDAAHKARHDPSARAVTALLEAGLQ